MTRLEPRAQGVARATRHRGRPAPALLLLAALAACTSEPPQAVESSAAAAAAAAALAQAGTIPLEGDGNPPLLRLEDLAVDADGNLLVLDGGTARVHKYDASGMYLASVTGSDGGVVALEQPGGARPHSVVVGSDEHLYVTGAPPGSVAFDPASSTAAVTRISPDLAVDTFFIVQDVYLLSELHAWNQKLAAVLMRPAGPGNEVATFGYDGTPDLSFHPRDPRMDSLPYWSGWFTTQVGIAGRELVAVNSLYPAHRYGSAGEETGTFGAPSPSFRHPSQPERWAFGGPEGRDNYDAWLKSFTTIAGLHVLSGSVAVVVLKDLNPDESAFAEASYRADVFDVESGQSLGRDLPLPGNVVEAGEMLYVAVRDPEQGWRVELFNLELDR